jgi:Cu-processing system permease protein
MATGKILKYVAYDLLRSRLVITYALLLLLISFGVIYIGRDVEKATLSLLNIVLIIVPLVSIIFGTIHYYNSRHFIEMLLTQPVNRSVIFWSEYFGLSVSLSFALIAGVGIPLLIYGVSVNGAYLILIGVLLTFIFSGLAFLSSVKNQDKAKGMGLSLMIWFFFAVIFDGLILLIYMFFSDYPLDKFMIAISALNPVDLARISMLLRMDISALMGYTGATIRNFFGSSLGTIYSISFMMLWIIIPVFIARRIFSKKNF